MRPEQKRRLLYDNSPPLATAWFELGDQFYKSRYRKTCPDSRIDRDALRELCEDRELNVEAELFRGFVLDDEPSHRGYMQHQLLHKLVKGDLVAIGRNAETWTGELLRVPLPAPARTTTINWCKSFLRINLRGFDLVRVADRAAAVQAGIVAVRRGPTSYESQIIRAICEADADGYPLTDKPDVVAEHIRRRVRMMPDVPSGHVRGLSDSKIKTVLRRYLRSKHLDTKLTDN